MRPFTWLGLCIVLASFSPLRAEDTLRVSSCYLPERLLGGLIVSLEGTLGGEATLTVDPNNCQLDAFGDPTVCTRIAALPRQVTLRKLDQADPQGAGRQLYAVEGEGLDATVRLSVGPGEHGVVRLIVAREGQQRPTVVTLERRAPADEAQARPGPAGQRRPARGEQETRRAEAAYSAVQWGDTVWLFANGVHRTGGYQVSLEMRPERRFPRAFNLKVTPPDGPATEALTPFSAHTHFSVGDSRIASLTVHDRFGAQSVPVVALAD